jgi:hypothetical protein
MIALACAFQRLIDVMDPIDSHARIELGALATVVYDRGSAAMLSKKIRSPENQGLTGRPKY